MLLSSLKRVFIAQEALYPAKPAWNSGTCIYKNLSDSAVAQRNACLSFSTKYMCIISSAPYQSTNSK